jgi:hypothetical protein
MAARIFAVAIPSAVGFAYLERYILPSYVPFLYAPTTLLGGVASRAVGVTFLVTCLACFWLTMHGFAVGSARAHYRELARKDDEKDVDARCEWRARQPSAESAETKQQQRPTTMPYPSPSIADGLPNLYVDGGSKHARAFNCVQRSHQQAFETLPQLLFMTGVATFAYPLTAAANIALWLLGRITWTHGYVNSAGDPAKRYDSPFAFLIFASYMAQFFVAMATAAEVAGLTGAIAGETKSAKASSFFSF